MAPWLNRDSATPTEITKLPFDGVREYLQPVKIEVAGEVLYRTPSVDD